MEEIKIGNQIWMKSNLNTNCFKNGDVILQIQSNEEWEKASEERIPCWCFYNNDKNFGEEFGKLYNWHAVNDSRGIAPEGWEIASDKDWSILTDFIGGNEISGTKLKSETNWWASEKSCLDEYLFTAQPAGYRSFDGTFLGKNTNSVFWTSTENESDNEWSWARELDYFYDEIFRNDEFKGSGFSVRCLKKII
jgi:uncharacterized protein (TIGR02145 family)